MKRKISILRLLFEAGVCCVFSFLSKMIFPFVTYSRVFGELRSVPDNKELFLLSNVGEVFWAVERVSRLFPWRLSCLVKVHAASLMLRRRKQSFYAFFGVGRATADSTPISAHAWLEVNNSTAFLKEEGRFSVIASYFYQAY